MRLLSGSPAALPAEAKRIVLYCAQTRKPGNVG